MAADPELIASLTAAVTALPDDVVLRLHLVDLLLEAGDAPAALDHCGVVLGRHPDHVGALDRAAVAAMATGDTERSAAYRRMADALRTEPAPLVPLATSTDTPLVEPSEIDAFLDEVLSEADGGDRVVLADVGGMEAVKRRLDVAFLGPMRNPELRKMYGKSLRGGLLLWGPPGCGKTFLARAVAGELGARFFSLGLHDVLDMWLGKSEQNLHAVFEKARRVAPCVLFLDEVDALGMKRSNLAHSGGRNVVVQLLAELDGADVDNEGLFLLAATNQPWDVDPALRRPGRLDRTVLVLPPDEAARRTILALHLRDRPVGVVDVDRLAASTDGFSGADLRALCETAVEHAMADSLARGGARPIGMEDFGAAMAEVKPSTRDWFESARNYAVYANEGGAYDELLAYLRERGWE